MGVRAPGGTIVRVSLDGSKVETVCGGIRNSYEPVFNRYGDLFFHDSDMEADMGFSWYRPTQVYHVPHGADFGWRSGWAKFPGYFMDTLPPLARTGRGSPTGAVLYQHFQFPVRYHNKIFMADWSEGRILVMHDQRKDASYQLKEEVFLTGKPGNIVDLEVGEDGTLYFCTGGRGTSGGVFRVVWNGTIPPEMLSYNNDLERIIRHPQPMSAWARQNVALLKKRIGNSWNTAIEGVAKEVRNEIRFRLRALEAMVFYGPFPSDKLLQQLSEDGSPELRARVAELCGMKKSEANMTTLKKLLADEDGMVRRRSCESYLRLQEYPGLDALLPILASKDRFEAVAARRLLERQPSDQWADKILKAEDIRQFIQGGLALVTSDANLKNSYDVLARSSEFMKGFVSDADFIDLLRLVQISLIQGNVDASKIPAFVDQVVNEFPAGDGLINRQLALLMARLKVGEADGRVAHYLADGNESFDDRLYVAMMLHTLGSELPDATQLAVIDVIETARTRTGGGSYLAYLQRAIKPVTQDLTSKQIETILDNGDRWPNAMVAVYHVLPEELSAETIQKIIAADRKLKPNNESDVAARRMRLGTIAVLAQSGDEVAMDYLREIWGTRTEYRNEITIGLGQQPAGKNWGYLVSSIPVLDDQTSADVLSALLKVNQRPKKPDALSVRDRTWIPSPRKSCGIRVSLAKSLDRATSRRWGAGFTQRHAILEKLV